MNRYKPHVYVIPEDDCDRQLADGFVLHISVDTRRVQVMPPCGGWGEVLDRFKVEYIRTLREYPMGHVVMLIDFDGDYADRRARFEEAIPSDLRGRVFVVGAKLTPEALRNELGRNFEEIGKSLADDCDAGTEAVWGHDHLRHNDADRVRLLQVVKPILFGA